MTLTWNRSPQSPLPPMLGAAHEKAGWFDESVRLRKGDIFASEVISQMCKYCLQERDVPVTSRPTLPPLHSTVRQNESVEKKQVKKKVTFPRPVLPPLKSTCKGDK